jgi:glycosyltransferase involved in cell wall biosynthesis
MPKVSILMSVYDGVSASQLVEAVDSMLAQSLVDFEFLIMQDGIERADLTEYLTDLSRRDSRVRLLRNSGRKGLPYSLNRLIENASASYLARMDADDISLPLRLERQAKFLDANPDVLILGCFAREVDDHGARLFDKAMPTDHGSIRGFMAKRDPFIHPTVMFRREFFERCGLYSESSEYWFLEDTELWKRALLAGCQTANLPEYLFHFRASAAMYSRRRGWRLAWNEAKLRLLYCRQARLPLHYFAYPLLVGAIRMSPPAVTRFAYRRLRGQSQSIKLNPAQVA